MNVDLLVIGGGSGGIATARRAAQHGATVAVVEHGPLGGTCVNVGCVPKKVMWHAAQLAEAGHDAAGYGFDWQLKGQDWAALVERRQAYVQRLNGIYAHNLEQSGVAHISGSARFVGSHEVEVGNEVHRAERILIASGSKPEWPVIPGAELGADSDGFFSWHERPERVIVVGAGYIAVELAGVLRALGSQVAMLVRGDRLLKHFDRDLGRVLEDEMRNAGVELLFNQKAIEVRQQENTRSVIMDDHSQRSVEAVLWATGRVANTADLDLQAAGVASGRGGEVVVDEWQASSQPHIFAVGDVTGAPALTPVAIAAGRRLADRLYGGQSESRLDYGLVPTAVFSHPPIGTVGLSEEQAIAEFGAEAVRCYRSEFKSLYYGVLETKVQSLVKLVCVGPEERVCGVHSIGPGSDELLQGFAVAMSCGATKADFDRTIAIHPTAAEELVTLR